MPKQTADYEEQMLRAAELYYYGDYTQAEAAEKLGVTRWTVGRLLDDARKTGIVRIVIDHPRARRHELEVRLRQEYGLREVIVLPSQPSSAITLRSVCSAAAMHLASIRPSIRRIAVSWGRTVAAVAAELPNGWTRGIEVVQTNGGPTVTQGNPVGESLYALAEKGGGSVRSLAGPTILEDARVARLLRSDGSIAGTLKAAEACRVMLYSPGSVSPDDSVLVRSGYLSAEQMRLMEESGAVGDVMSHFITIDGSIADPGLDARTLSMNLDAVQRCPNAIVVAAGARKALATRAAVTAGLCTTLIVDGVIATALLEAHPQTHEEDRRNLTRTDTPTHPEERKELS